MSQILEFERRTVLPTIDQFAFHVLMPIESKTTLQRRQKKVPETATIDCAILATAVLAGIAAVCSSNSQNNEHDPLDSMIRTDSLCEEYDD